ncbi:MAG: ribosome silencing factor [Methylobacteriaceae bacterium]|nr:ribosome silencing factor [Methylobacteriaceae bacterium]
MFADEAPENRLRAPDRNAPLTPHARSHASPVRAVLSAPEAIVAHPPDILSQTVMNGLEDAKAEEVVAIDLKGKSTLADRMFIATGRSTTHVGAIADRIVRACRDAGFPSPRVEGMPLCDWVLLDARDVIIHIFRPDVRRFYNLEKMWSADRPDELSIA